jgi:transposase
MEKFCVGIDVSAKKLDVAFREGKGRVERETFENASAGHKALVRHLKKRAAKKVIRVVLESTGVYGFDLALALDGAGFEVMVANPRASANFAKATMQRSKTDRLDCVMLLEFAEQMTFKRWQAPSVVQLQIRTISRRVHALISTIRDEKNRMHAANQVDGTDVVKKSIRATIKALDKQVRELRAAALGLIRSESLLERRYELLLTVKGIGEISAIAILAELAILPPDMADRSGSRTQAWIRESASPVHRCACRRGSRREATSTFVRRSICRHAWPAASSQAWLRTQRAFANGANSLCRSTWP